MSRPATEGHPKGGRAPEVETPRATTPTEGLHEATGAPARPSGLYFALLCGVVGLGSLGASAIYPLLARIQAAHHLGTYSLGLMAGAFYVAALAAQLFGGRLLDGRKARPVLLTGAGVGAVAMLWFGLASNLWQLVGARALDGLCFGVVIPASLKAASAAADPTERGTRIGRITAAQTAGLIFGPIVGTALAASGNLALPFLAVAAAEGAVFAALLVASHRSSATSGPQDEPERSPETLVLPAPSAQQAGRPAVAAVASLLLLAAGAQFSLGLYDALWSRLITDRGGSDFLIGLSLTLYGIPIVFLSPAAGRFAARRGPLLVTSVALTITFAFMASYGLIASAVLVVALSIGEAFFQALAVPGALTAVDAVYPHERAATGQGLFGAAGTAAAGVAALVSAPLYSAVGPGFVFAGTAAVSFAFVVAAFLTGRGSIDASGPGAARTLTP